MRITASLRNDGRRQSPDGPAGPSLRPRRKRRQRRSVRGGTEPAPTGLQGIVTMEKLAEEEKGSGWLCRPLPVLMRFYTSS